MPDEIQAFHYPALEGKRVVYFQVMEPSGYIQIGFEDDLTVHIGAELSTSHPSLRHGASQILTTARTAIAAFDNGKTADLRVPVLRSPERVDPA